MGILQEATNLLAGRIIYLQVTGAVRSPVIRLRPLPILTQEAARFFLKSR